MTTVTVIIDKDKKPQYKDYVQFLGGYKNGKKNESDHSSSSSLAGDLTDLNEMPTKSFSEYLQDYNNKKYQPVHPTLSKKQEEPKNVKTEVFLQINNTNGNDIYKENQIKITLPKPTADENDGEQIKVSVGKLSQKFKNSTISNNRKNTTPASFLKRSSSITEKTKLFEENNEEKSSAVTKINRAISIEKFPKKEEGSVKKSHSYHKPNATFIEIRKQELQNSPRLNDTIILPQLPTGKVETTKQNPIISNSNLHNLSDIQINCNGKSDHQVNEISGRQEHPVNNKIKDSNFVIPPPPPPPPPSMSLPPKASIPKFPNSSQKSLESTHSKKLNSSVGVSLNPVVPKIQTNGCNTLSKAPNGYSTLPKMQNNKMDASNSSSLERNDPRMKKMVYGALRDMYGAYHDKANDYLATLPKNRVKKGNGLDSIINSIAAQGGLEKLCGRANPKSETDSI